MYVYKCICMYLYVSVMHVCSSFIIMYVLVSSCIYLQLKATSDEEAEDVWDGGAVNALCRMKRQRKTGMDYGYISCSSSSLKQSRYCFDTPPQDSHIIASVLM
jgi:hypothetical protein